MAITKKHTFTYKVGSDIYYVSWYKCEYEARRIDHDDFCVRLENQDYHRWPVFSGSYPANTLPNSECTARNWIQARILEGALGIPAQEIE